MYNNNGKSQLMHVFDHDSHGQTHAKPLEDIDWSVEEPNVRALEVVFAEIISDCDLKVFYAGPIFHFEKELEEGRQ